MIKHDTIAHIQAGGFGVKADACPGCEHTCDTPMEPRPGQRWVCPDCGLRWWGTDMASATYDWIPDPARRTS